MKQEYVDKTFHRSSLDIIDNANEIILDYMGQGFQLTLRQLYYQFVARDLLSNTQQSYNRLGSIINDARLAGMVDWDAIEDRTRNLASVSHWRHPSDIVEACAEQFKLDKWMGQKNRVEVWIEKEALAGVIEPVCQDLQVSYLSCRGYLSQSEMHVAALRIKEYAHSHAFRAFNFVILHLGDHDPSGIDMTRDIENRMSIFGVSVEVKRIALNMDQVEEYEPPPNPAKMTDSRFDSYLSEYGSESWELDALEPSVMADLIKRHVLELRDHGLWHDMLDKEKAFRSQLRDISEEYEWE